MAFEIWPSVRNTAMPQVMLDANGADSGLSSSFQR